ASTPNTTACTVYDPPRAPPPANRRMPQVSDNKGHPHQLQSRREGYHAAWQAKRQEAATAANSPHRIKAAAELLPEEQPKLDAVDVEEQEELAHKFAAAIPAMPSSLARELSHMSLAAGIGNCSPSILQLGACNTFEVADSYQCYFVPVVQTFGQTGAHVRPTMPGSGINTGSEIDFPAVAFYCQASVGEFDLHSVQTAVAKELRISKGLQGMLIMGAIRTKDRWAFNAAFTRIRGHGTATPHPPMTLPVPEDWLQDNDYLDTRRSMSSTCCVILLKKELPAFPVTNLHPAHFLYQGWNSYWLRWIAAGKEAYFIVARTKAEMVLAGELLSQIRAQGLDIDDWLKQVEDWVEAQDTDDFLTKIRRTAVIWGVPPATVTKLQKQPLAKLIAVGSYMERCVFRALGIVPGCPSFQQFSAESVLYLRFSPIKKHAKLFYVGSTEKSVMIREHSRFRKYKQVLEEKLVSAELSIRFWAHHRTFWNWCIVPVTDVVPHDLLRGREQALIQTLQPPLNFPFIARWFCPRRGIIKPPDATHAQKIGLSRLWRKRRKKQHSGAGPPRGLTEVFEQIWEKHLTQAFSKGDVYELLRQDLAGFFNSISQSQFLHAWRITLEFYRRNSCESFGADVAPGLSG
ncbi:unnamed protein product, partial [Symbiodinium sp. KB8]